MVCITYSLEIGYKVLLFWTDVGRNAGNGEPRRFIVKRELQIKLKCQEPISSKEAIASKNKGMCV